MSKSGGSKRKRRWLASKRRQEARIPAKVMERLIGKQVNIDIKWFGDMLSHIPRLRKRT